VVIVNIIDNDVTSVGIAHAEMDLYAVCGESVICVHNSI
jgi:hypothetical protein